MEQSLYSPQLYLNHSPIDRLSGFTFTGNISNYGTQKHNDYLLKQPKSHAERWLWFHVTTR